MNRRAERLILDAANADDRRQWLEIWMRWEEREVWAHPLYAALFARECDRCLCACLSLPDGAVLFPMILRPLSAEAWASPEERRWDMTSPYGYGGAFAWGEGRAAGPEFWKWIVGWLREAGVVTWFCRLGLFPEQLLAGMPGCESERTNVVRRTDLSLEEIWNDYAHKVRKNVKRARAGGLTCEAEEDGRGLGEFLEVYYGTLRRREAAAHYFFPREMFERLLEGLKGQYAFFHVREGGTMLSSELVLVSARHVYSYLGGTLSGFESRPNDLLKHEVVEWAHRRGKRAFVLGGGAAPQDGVFRYKLSFAPRGEAPFFVSRVVLDEEAELNLVAERRKNCPNWTGGKGYFPPYRA